MRLAMAILILSFGSLASAGQTMYKCESAGKIIYQGTECDPSKASNARGSAISITTNGTTDLDPKNARRCMEQDTRKYKVPLTEDSKIEQRKRPSKERLRDWLLGVDC